MRSSPLGASDMFQGDIAGGRRTNYDTPGVGGGSCVCGSGRDVPVLFPHDRKLEMGGESEGSPLPSWWLGSSQEPAPRIFP